MTIIYFILVLGGIVFFHELGHFIFAKKAGVYIYEFSIGMGPQLIKWKSKKDETVYSIRLFPIGGFVQMAGEDIEEDKNIPKEKQMNNKTWIQRFLIMFAGILFNFILAFVLLLIVGFINGTPKDKVYISRILDTSNAYEQGLRDGHVVTKINNKTFSSKDMMSLELIVNAGKEIKIEYIDSEGQNKETIVKADSDDNNNYKYGFALTNEVEKGFFTTIKYAFFKTFELIKYMFTVICYLITGKIGLGSLSGPVGIFTMVGETAKEGILNLVYLMAIISVNVGFVNLLPLPAFDGGRILFIIIEKIKGSPINPNTENKIHAVGLVLLMILMVFITFNDILRLF